ncbi:exodeoxyribonuclease V subunit beta [Alteromonas sp. a30]|uniref:exodeoxyribonuclease V subunit beta n=1 Tax=Alteromonas sp. a30 TaxID=2730917 RepID=UPI00227F421C|nr:exodeoxyribonuclease V subunit beta [Alteromonas sp. a30]MCY7293964.1 exodeoxyribonuclease V subunit beta [Alteromonas sp. a30]
MQTLNPIDFPLNGASLIEASAGTGKTYTISSFYLRLILGHECEPRQVDQVLIVTFTNAATDELKSRLHARLHEAFLDFERGNSDDEFVQTLIAAQSDLRLAKQRLLVAQQNMDNAAIYTIHGFCQRTLLEHAFESGVLYDQTLILDDSEWQRLAISDYWRQFVATLSDIDLQGFIAHWNSPEALLAELRPLIHREVHLPQVSKSDYDILLQEYAEAVKALKHWWLEQKVMQALIDADLKGNVKVGKPETLSQMQEFAQSEALTLRIVSGKSVAGFDVFCEDKVRAALKKTSNDISHLDFSQFDRLVELKEKVRLALKQYYLGSALNWLRQRLVQQKQRYNLISPDDLLQNLYQALQHPQNGTRLAQTIFQQYPVALVDEFQDTDPLQFGIFSDIYLQQHGTLVLIGDPKQAIYGFRGGDIFTYLSAKQRVDASRHYTLAKNYRSQRHFIDSMNQLFMPENAAFEFGDGIPYHSVSAHKDVNQLANTSAALNFLYLPQTEEKLWSWGAASQYLAQECAQHIADLLGKRLHSSSNLHTDLLLDGQPLQAKDICVLVRDRGEAEIIKQALAQTKVDSVYLARKSVFSGAVAYQLLLLLRAIHSPQDEGLVRAAMLTELFPYTLTQFDELVQNELQWHQVLQTFKEAHHLWNSQGVMRGLNHILQGFNTYEHLMAHFDDGLRRITDVRHVGELLQVEASVIQGEGLLLQWFENRLAEPDHGHEAQQLRLETDENLVQITTIHASKGLQYPLVFLPFASRFKAANNTPYHKEGEGLVWDVEPDDNAQMLQEAQRLGEDSRLLYVALTRAMYHCWIGFWNNGEGRSVKNSAFLSTALGQVLFHQADLSQSIEINDAAIIQRLERLSQSQTTDYSIIEVDDEVQPVTEHSSLLAPEAESSSPLLQYQAASLSRTHFSNWTLTSYSSLSQHHQARDFLPEEVSKAADEQGAELPSKQVQAIENAKLPMRFRFEKGANPGSFLHAIYELSDWQTATQTLDDLKNKRPEQHTENWMSKVLPEQAKRYGIVLNAEQNRRSVNGGSQLATDEFIQLQQWIADTLNTPLFASSFGANAKPDKAAGDDRDNTHNPRLIDISESQRLAELEFYLPLNALHQDAFNQLITSHGFPARTPYQFGQLSGMLKGFIDLTFEWNGRFYVADYKSNHLGNQFEDYAEAHLDAAMKEHDYYLQGLFYTVALHRYLQLRIANYDYDTHMGGAVYLFIRGMSENAKGTGVLHFVPQKSLVLGLDALFSGLAPHDIAGGKA